MGPTKTPTTLWREECLICPLTASSPEDAIRQLVGQLAGQPEMQDAAEFQRAADFREGENSTYLGSGIALPHARTDAVSRVIVGVGVAPAGVPWPTAAESAQAIFLVGVPRKLVRDYLELVRSISKAARQPNWLERARQSADPAALAAMLRATVGG